MGRKSAGGPRLLLIDTNLLLVLVIGAHDPEHVERFRRTRTYSVQDFAVLTAFAAKYNQIVITPNILTEVSNLAGQLSEPLRTKVFQSISALAQQSIEKYFASSSVVVESEFIKLGLADVSVLLAARERVAVLTDDLPLYLRLAKLNLKVFNFNRLRLGKRALD